MERIEHLDLKKAGPNGVSASSAKVFSYHTHIHAYYEMILYEPFDGYLAVNNNKIAVKSPTAVLLTPSDLHRIQVNGISDAEFIKICFAPSLALLKNTQLPRSSLLLRNIGGGYLLSLFQELLQSCQDPVYASLLIQTALYIIETKGKAFPPVHNLRAHDLVISASKLLNEHFCDSITLTDTASLLSVTPQYLSKLFSAEMGISFSAYLCDLRLCRAAELLKSSDKTITEICYECGHENLSHFHRSFKKKYGVTPGDYRNQFLP